MKPLTALQEGNKMDSSSRDHDLTAGDGDGSLPVPPADNPQFRCTRCGRDEIDCRANGCERGPCPMEYVG